MQYLIWKVQIGITILVLIIGLTSCSDSPDRIDGLGGNYSLGEQITETFEVTVIGIGTEKLLAFKTAMDVLAAIKDLDYQLLAKYAHSEKGIIFSSDAFVNYDEDPVFKAEQIKEFNPDTVYKWGYYEASEIPLELTVNEYFNLNVYSKDFIHCRQVGINSIIRSGNCPENVAEMFPSGIFIEFHDEGTKEFDQLDWASLKIVLEKYNGTFKVVAIISSNYTL